MGLYNGQNLSREEWGVCGNSLASKSKDYRDSDRF